MKETKNTSLSPIFMPNIDFEYAHTCKNCTAQLQVEKDDISFHYKIGNMNEPFYDRWFATCHICKVEFNVLVKHISKAVQAEIKSKKKFEER